MFTSIPKSHRSLYLSHIFWYEVGSYFIYFSLKHNLDLTQLNDSQELYYSS